MKRIHLLCIGLCLSISLWAQSPEKMSYQAVIRNSNNELLTNKEIGIEIKVLKGSITGNAVYVETHTATTNANGLISLEIGSGNATSGSFSTIDWANGSFYIQTKTDPNGGTNYSIIGTSQLLSVPYALYAKASGSGAGKDGVNGKSAYEIWKSIAGNENKSETEFLASLKGETGAIGLKGDKGDTGLKGEQGNAGIAFDDTKSNTDKTWTSAKIETELSKKAEVSTISKLATSGDYADLKNVPTIPSKTSELSNDANFLTKEVQALSIINDTLFLTNGGFVKLPYTEGTGVDIVGTTISAKATSAMWNANKLQGRSVSTTAPKTDQVLQYNGTSWIPADNAPNATHTGDVTGATTLTIAPNAVNSAKIEDASITAADIAANTITANKLAAMGATKNQVLQYNGTTWIPADIIPQGGIIYSETSTSTSLNDAGYTCIGKTTTTSQDAINDQGSWTAINTVSTPIARVSHSAIWTGSEMIVWGGDVSSSNYYNTNSGARYNPTNDSWTAISVTGAPTARSAHSAVWTGSEMIIWGGLISNPGTTMPFNTGGKYFPNTNTWVTISTTNAPEARSSQSTIWTGTDMIVWGGFSKSANLNSGGIYNPKSDSWTTISSTSAPSVRRYHSAIWTGSEMIIWGGYDGTALNTGGRFNPTINTWSSISSLLVPDARFSHTAVWTGTDMIIWGGSGLVSNSTVNTGGIYNPAKDIWTTTSIVNVPTERNRHTAIWTGTEMIIWGGRNTSNLTVGGKYNPITNTWLNTAVENEPSARFGHSAIWTGTEMIIWGGSGTDLFNTGGRYNPNGISFSPTKSKDVYMFKKN